MTLKYNSKNKQAGFLLKLVTKSAMQKEAGRVQVLGKKTNLFGQDSELGRYIEH